jgi:CRP/FNR family transcriptional regulator, cyclic AMP receptor protein
MKNTLCGEHELLFLQRLPLDARQSFGTIARGSRHETGSVLFSAGEGSQGVFLLRSGKAKLEMSSGKGKTLTLRIAWPGELLGLSATITGNPYEGTATTMGPSEADFVARADFLRLLDCHPEACFQVVQMLSHEMSTVEDRMGFFRAARSASGNLARLLLAWCEDGGAETEEGIRLLVPLTEREIGQMIGTTWETIARLLGALKNKGIAQRIGRIFLIQDKPALERIVKPEAKRLILT